MTYKQFEELEAKMYEAKGWMQDKTAECYGIQAKYIKDVKNGLVDRVLIFEDTLIAFGDTPVTWGHRNLTKEELEQELMETPRNYPEARVNELKKMIECY